MKAKIGMTIKKETLPFLDRCTSILSALYFLLRLARRSSDLSFLLLPEMSSSSSPLAAASGTYCGVKAWMQKWNRLWDQCRKKMKRKNDHLKKAPYPWCLGNINHGLLVNVSLHNTSMNQHWRTYRRHCRGFHDIYTRLTMMVYLYRRN